MKGFYFEEIVLAFTRTIFDIYRDLENENLTDKEKTITYLKRVRSLASEILEKGE